MSTSQLNKLKSGIKNSTETILNLSLNVIGNSGDEANFANKLLITDIQVWSICKTFGNVSSFNLKLWKTQLSNMVQSGRFLLPSGSLGSLPPVENDIELKELRNKEIDDPLVDTGFNIVG